ncbi:MAG: chromosomal replication initiator protein DnaA [Bacteroidales bacterium]|jgi:chromosomal replication initiator protein|nr:chromosomal replication initiator protein DnaA [Bacteroidales bacterium]
MHQEIWNRCLLIFKDNLEWDKYKTFFEPIMPVSVKQNVLTIQVPTLFYYEYMEEHYIDLLKKTIRRVLGQDARLEYRIAVNKESTTLPGSSGQLSNPATRMFPDKLPNPYYAPGIPGKTIQINPQLKPEYSFDNFVEGECNRMAGSAGLTIANDPGKTAFNPFFIFGEPGLGKTHLAQAIGIKVKEQMPGKTVLYVDATKFRTQYVDAQLKNQINDFLHFYQYIDVLIIDDVQYFEGQTKTQQTFFDIFNHLHQRNRQLILTSDRPPVDLQGLINERLLSRFKWGLSAELKEPDYATRLEILKRRAYRDGIRLPEEVLEYVAKNIADNVRELEGALNGLMFQATQSKKDITLETARATIERLVKHSRPEISISYILHEVADYNRLNEHDILSSTRKREIVQARQIAMYLSKQFTKNSLKSIGNQLGNKDHATVLHACRTVNNLMETDRLVKGQVDALAGRLRQLC